MRFPCKVENGKLVILNRSEFDSIIADLNGDYYIEIVETGVRSSQQNNYYWKIVDMLAEELGYTRNEMHGAIKDHFEIRTTKTLTTKEFSQFIERIIRWSAIDLGVMIPDTKTLLQSS
tara:strand:+ start:166 stop:519 length:354 start_codon:yes stop_codon:yes gene_type:complete